MLRVISHFLVLTLTQLIVSTMALGQADVSLYLGAGKPGTGSFELGVGITSLVKVRLLPSDGIDLTLVETAAREVNGELLIMEQADIEGLSGIEPITGASIDQLRSIMVFRPGDGETGPILELIVRDDVDEEAIYLITKCILENAIFLEDLNKRSWSLSADEAISGLSLPLHAGSIRYYEQIGEANLSQEVAYGIDTEEEEAAETAETSENDNTFILDFLAEASTLDDEGYRLIAEACQYANVFGASEIRVNGASANDEDGLGALDEERKRYVIAELRSNTSCTPDINIVDAGPLSDAPPSTAFQDQVEVTIMLP